MWTTPPVEELTAELADCERQIAEMRARQIVLLRYLDRVQIPQRDGHRSLQEWTADRLDLRPETARELVWAARTLPYHRSVAFRLADRESSYDRAVVAGKLAATGVSPDVVEQSFHLDVDAVRRLTARHRRITRSEEHATAGKSHFTIQPSLDETRYRLWGELTAYDGRMVEKAVTERSDQLGDLPSGDRLSRGQRRAAALVGMAEDSLGRGAGTDTLGVGGQVAIFVDLDRAGATEGEVGAEIEYGPRVGPATLERVLCGGSVQVVGLAGGRPIVTSDNTRAIPPALRRFVAWRDGGCTISGCASRYRLQPHHIDHRAHGGDHDPENLATLCWFHHHVMIHNHGYHLDPDSPRHRRRLVRPTRGPDPP